jgi:lysozyme
MALTSETKPSRTTVVLAALLLIAMLSVAMLPAVAAPRAATPGSDERVDHAAGDSMREAAPTEGCSAKPPSGSDAFLPGIDISHWNGAIQWGKVKADGIKFAYAKATQGLDFKDPKYAANKAGAKKVHLRFGAYDYMDVAGDAGHARKDADRFVHVADLGDSNLVPVLDAEQTNGYSPARLQKWVVAWLDEVYKKTGVRAIIYSSPSFWTSAFADTTWFSRHGYRLWIAHWFVDSPTLPAQDWDGRGWTFWQWTDCGSVAGISGRVDLNLFQGQDLMPVVIKKAKT